MLDVGSLSLVDRDQAIGCNIFTQSTIRSEYCVVDVQLPGRLRIISA